MLFDKEHATCRFNVRRLVWLALCYLTCAKGPLAEGVRLA